MFLASVQLGSSLFRLGNITDPSRNVWDKLSSCFTKIGFPLFCFVQSTKEPNGFTLDWLKIEFLLPVWALFKWHCQTFRCISKKGQPSLIHGSYVKHQTSLGKKWRLVTLKRSHRVQPNSPLYFWFHSLCHYLCCSRCRTITPLYFCITGGWVILFYCVSVWHLRPRSLTHRPSYPPCIVCVCVCARVWVCVCVLQQDRHGRVGGFSNWVSSALFFPSISVSRAIRLRHSQIAGIRLFQPRCLRTRLLVCGCLCTCMCLCACARDSLEESLQYSWIVGLGDFLTSKMFSLFW